MNDDLKILTYLHQSISRPGSVYADCAPALKRVIDQLSNTAPVSRAEPLTVRGEPADPAPVYKWGADGRPTLTNVDKMPSYAVAPGLIGDYSNSLAREKELVKALCSARDLLANTDGLSKNNIDNLAGEEAAKIDALLAAKQSGKKE